MSDAATTAVTFLFTSIEGSTQLWEQQPEAMRLALRRHDACLRAAIESHHGRIFKTIGDACCAAFSCPLDAVAAAVAAQRAVHDFGSWILELGARPRSSDPPTQPPSPSPDTDQHPETLPTPELGDPTWAVRIALHTGTAELREGDYFGPALNRVARLRDAGHGGQLLLSQSTADLVQDHLPPGVWLRCLGAHRLRDLRQPERVYQLLHPELPVEFPPLHARGDSAHNLPLSSTLFVGRERERAEIQRWLAGRRAADPRQAPDSEQRLATGGREPAAGGPRLLTLTGTGGTGKTRLALEVAADLSGEYEDGVWLVELVGLGDPAMVPQAVAAALQVRERPGRPIAQTLAESVRSRHLLLILDNCEHLLAACASLVQTLLGACPDLSVLATSRERLNLPGEQTYPVPALSLPPLDEDSWPGGEGFGTSGSTTPLDSSTSDSKLSTLLASEAVQLFLDRAALVQPSFTLSARNAPAVAQVCHQLGGIPLAIELAASRLTLLTVEQIAPRLEDLFRALPEEGCPAPEPDFGAPLCHSDADPPQRQQTLRALIDWSYDSLSPAEQMLLRRLTVFAGGFTLEAVETVCPGDQLECEAVLDLLGQLVEKSLVMVEEREVESRYRLLETIRQYGSERLWEAGEGAVARWRYRSWFLGLAEQALAALGGPERAEALQRLSVEYGNLRAALGPAGRTHPPRETGGVREDLPLLPTRLARWARLAEQLAPVYRRMGRGEAARGVLEDYIALCEAENDAAGLARAYTLMGRFLALNAGGTRQPSHRAMYQRAIELCAARALPELGIEPQSLLAYELAADGSDLEWAEAMVRDCLPAAEALPDRVLRQRLHTCSMWIATHRADWQALRAAFGASLACGGPLEIPLHLMLTRIEECFRRQGARAEFIDLCHELADGYAGAGLEAPYVAWYLGAAVSRPPPDEPWLRESFDQPPWHPSLRWLDATGRSRTDSASRPGWLGLYPARGANLWPVQDLDAPRLVATVTGDFVAQTCVELGPIPVLAGLLVWRDEAHFARLEMQERALDEERPTIQLEACVDGQFHILGRGEYSPSPDLPGERGWLRIERDGNELRAWCSADAEQWSACGTVRFPPGESEQVGLAAIAHGPDAHAWFDTLLLW